MRKIRWLIKRNDKKTAVNSLTAFAAAVATAAAALAAVTPVTARAGVPRPAAPSVPALRWHSCQGTFQCATARVPLDYRQPLGSTITIAVIRHQATDPKHRLGSLFFNSGGPAEQIGPFLDSYPQIPAELRARFDIVSFDPRGFDPSSAISCFPTLAAEHKFLGGFPLQFPVNHRQQVAFERTAARFDALCASRGGALLSHDSTADVARDMDLLRQAVGDPVLNYLGQSYGTGLGAVYANLFPARVGHLVFDGNLDPVAWTHGGSLPTPLRDRRDVADAQTMRAFLDLCGRAAVKACAFSAGTPAATRAKFSALLRRLLRHQVIIGNPAHTWTYADVITVFPEYQASAWPDDAAALQQLWLASDPEAPGRQPPPGTSPEPPLPALEQIAGVACADSPNPRSPQAYEAAAKLAYARSGGFGLMLTWLSEACAGWPRAAAQDRYTGPWNRPTAHPILLIGNTVDPATPYWNSVAMSRDLARARLLTISGYGHTLFTNPSACATGYEVRYLTTGALPLAGTVCHQDAAPFGPAS